ncbi:MAG: FAD-binding oxidoreductase [Acidimicrobiales bacterium]
MSREPTMPNHYPSSTLNAPAPLANDVLNDLRASGVALSVDPLERAEHARDWWPLLIPDTARGHVERWPGVVVTAHSTADVSATLRVANEHRIAVTAQGGRSGVVGGASPSTGAIALDLTGLSHIVDPDERSATVRVEAGVFGPELEAFLNPRGFTVGHFPQSFDLATVGGWIACRGAGQYSNRCGKIEDIVRGLTVVLAGGEVIALGGHGPRQAVGPDLTQLFVGSEGTLGVITEATLLVRSLAPSEQRAAFSFTSFSDGLEACRRTLQRDAHPAVLRLYDETESKRSYDVAGCVLIVLDEGEEGFVDATMMIVREECRGATVLAEALVEQWRQHRNDVSALAPLWQRGLVVDTIEVSGPWALLPVLHARVSTALRNLKGMMVVSVHQSHAYLDGACLYFTFAAQPSDDVTAYYRAAWDVAMEQVLALGGAISHHHGVGRNRARFVPDALGGAFSVLEGLKDQLDPHHILNPGVLGIGGEAW